MEGRTKFVDPRRRITATTFCGLALGVATLIILLGIFVVTTVFYVHQIGTNPHYSPFGNPEQQNMAAPQRYFANQYQIKHDAVGAYINCPLDSPQAARDAGCSFDLLINGYIPNPCFDFEMNKYFMEKADFGYYEDEAATIVIPQSELIAGDFEKHKVVWLSTDSHYHHCMYIVNGSSRAHSRMGFVFLDSYLDQWHLQHCIGVIMEPRPPLPFQRMATPMMAAFLAEHRCYLRDLSPTPPENPGAITTALTHPQIESQYQ
ncbi:hypothetical protein LX32DRAFT_606063 [Colletotrichum zoysiae]|uniref:Uncharacterized protein n=1 Tax=Colletotrichum zoysiae TaxID=1216348 RepID=A0AAD9H1L4_9PEZI|nr:hypothetical protein LX32DRAFT_606063 [Colletotrichum zoysiae]